MDSAIGSAMQPQKLHISIRDNFVNRPDEQSIKTTGKEWVNVDLTLDEFITHIQKGFPFTHQFSGGVRKKEFFRRTNVLIADIDDGLSIDKALEDDFIKGFASFIYTTPRHTDEKHRFRIIFILERLIFDPDIYESMYRSLMDKMPTDPNTKSAAQFFNGSKNSKIYRINKVLSENQMNKLASDGVRKEVNEISPPPTEKLTLNTLVKGNDRKLHQLKTLTAKTSIYCPFKTHEDKHPSAFVLVSKDGIRGVECRSCGHKAWSEPLPTIDQFNYFDQLVLDNHGKENSHFEYQGLTWFDHDLETSMGKSNYHLINSQHIKIKELLPGIHLIKSPKGTGKTQMMVDIVDQIKNPKIRKKLGLSDDHQGRTILVGHRQTLIRESAQKLGLECYLDTGDYDTKTIPIGKWNSGEFRVVRIETKKPQHYAICLDSLHNRIKLNHEKYDVVIIDESEQVFSHFLSEHMSHPTSNFEILSRLIKNAKLVFCLDADLDQITLTGVMSCLSYSKDKGREIQSSNQHTKLLYCHLNTYKSQQRKIEVYTSNDHLKDDLRESIKQGKRCFITSNSKKFVQGLYESFSQVFSDKKFELVVSDLGDDEGVRYFLRNIKEEILNRDGLFSSPSIGTGIDITFPDNETKVDVVYGFFDTNINTHFDIDQQLGRVRHPGEVKVWVNPKRHRFSTNKEIIRRELLFGEKIKGLAYFLDQNGAYDSSDEHPFVDLLSTVIATRRTSMNRLRDNFIQYKKKTGWNVVFVEHNEPLAQKGAVIGKASRVARKKSVVQRLLDAPDFTQIDHMKIDAIKQRNGSLTDDQKAGEEKYWIKSFYKQEVTSELIAFDEDGKTRERIRLLEKIINPQIKHTSFKEIPDRVDLLMGSGLTPNELKEMVFLREVFEVAGIYDMKTFSFLPNALYETNSLKDFIKFLKHHRNRFSLIFNKEINEHIDERPANQLGSLLKMLGLGNKTIKKNKGGGTAIYQIDPDRYKTIMDIVHKRSQKDSKTTTSKSPK